MKWTMKVLSPAVITSPSRKVTWVTRRPLTLVPLVLPRSIRWQRGGLFSTWKCFAKGPGPGSSRIRAWVDRPTVNVSGRSIWYS